MKNKRFLTKGIKLKGKKKLNNTELIGQKVKF